jgi:endonuclease G, mitochondrial
MGRILRFVIGFAAALSIGCGSHDRPNWTNEAAESHPWGFYSGSPEARWNPDGRTMTLLNELRYTDPQGEIWIAPAGSVVDGASIPRSLWSVMGGPFEGRYRNASVLHDVSYDEHNRPWQDCDRMFYNAMRCSGVGAVEAKTMYYSLYKFGHHWSFPIRRGKAVKVKGEQIPRAIPLDTSHINEARDWIRSNNPSLDQIEQHADAERH